jgi:hypothetical protein
MLSQPRAAPGYSDATQKQPFGNPFRSGQRKRKSPLAAHRVAQDRCFRRAQNIEQARHKIHRVIAMCRDRNVCPERGLAEAHESRLRV